MTRRLLAAIAFVATTPVLATSQQFTGQKPTTKLPAPVLLDTTGRFLAVIARLGDDLYIAGQPTEQGLRELKDQGVTTVVNLRTPEEMQRIKFDEPALAASLGMKYIAMPMRGNDQFPYSPEAVTRFADALKSANGKVLLHCTVAWRASNLWMAYLIKERGVPLDTALASARAINLMDEHHQGPGTMPVEDFLGRRIPQLGHATSSQH
jgi:uncharacterized protein (TIGR01244 family)